MIDDKIRRNLEKTRAIAQEVRDFVIKCCEATQVMSGCHFDEDSCSGCEILKIIRRTKKMDGLVWETIARLYYGYDDNNEQEKGIKRIAAEREGELRQTVIRRYQKSQARTGWRPWPKHEIKSTNYTLT